MIFNREARLLRKLKRHGRDKLHPWFAWRPVIVDDDMLATKLSKSDTNDSYK